MLHRQILRDISLLDLRQANKFYSEKAIGASWSYVGIYTSGPWEDLK
jgi:hypothetical protein